MDITTNFQCKCIDETTHPDVVRLVRNEDHINTRYLLCNCHSLDNVKTYIGRLRSEIDLLLSYCKCPYEYKDKCEIFYILGFMIYNDLIAERIINELQ